MKYVYVLEDETRFQDEIFDALTKIDPKFEVRFFTTLQAFYDWIRLAMSEGPAALPKGGSKHSSLSDNEASPSQGNDHELILVVSKNEMMGSKNMALVRKTRDLFIRKKICTKQDPTNLVITTFATTDFEIKLVEDRIINNVLFKPFDKLILLQHLGVAAYGHHPPKTQAIAVSKTKAVIEMLEGVSVEFISDVGMVTVSNRDIKPGAILKYYSDIFKNNQYRSAIARCLACQPHPDIPNEYRCTVSFLGLNSLQISNLRRMLKDKMAIPINYPWLDFHADKKAAGSLVSILILESQDFEAQEIERQLNDAFSNIEIKICKSLEDLIEYLKTSTSRPDIILAEDAYFQESPKEKWKGILGPDFTTILFNICRKKLSDAEELKRSEVVLDILHAPLNWVHIVKKMKLFLPILETKESVEYATILKGISIDAASPIEVSEFSEAGVVMNYYRPISVGSFREFILWLPQENDLPVIRATCNYSVENDTKPVSYNNHFVFFGMNDHFLKHMRIWIREKYISSKKKD